MDKIKILKDFLEKLPNVESVIGYGSYFTEKEYDKAKQMDGIFLVKDRVKWHEDNYKSNKDLYSSSFTYKLLTKESDKLIVNYLHTEFNNQKIKFGIASKDKFMENLNTWEDTSFCGRCQKPIYTYGLNADDLIKIKQNKDFAMIFAIALTTKNVIPTNEFLKTLFNISFIGDIRTLFKFEDSKKAEKNIEQNMDFFYSNYILEYKNYIKEIAGLIYIDKERFIKDFFKLYLPISFIDYISLIQKKYNISFKDNIDNNELLLDIPFNIVDHLIINENISIDEVNNFILKDIVENYLYAKNLSASTRLAINSLYGAGPISSIKYLARKKSKYTKSKK